ncbi:MAG: ATP phosphoribosyltransferase regulatory subunit [Agathobacter sp.]|nr:ATP phosphoribosyltransferase regulatory subunit [Agathobacter sp.]
MKDQLLHTPDGVRDIYNGECKKKLLLQERLHHVLLKYGYHDIQTPTFEFFNIFSSQIGTISSKNLYKFFDKEGNTLVLRPDFTPSIARSAAKYYMEEDIPVKLCYMGNTFINSSDYQGKLKETTQCGAELIGDSSIAADAEILAMVVDSLQESGLRNFQISVGHAQFFTGLIEAAGINEEDEAELREYITNKNFFGVEEFVESFSLEDDLKYLFNLLGSFDTKIEELVEAKEKAKKYPKIYKALEDLENLKKYLDMYGIEKYISYELGIISEYHYYTGIIFSGYTFGTGEAIVKGGRYDSLLSHFGKEKAAIGFAIVVDQLMAALNRQKIEIPIMDNLALIVFDEKCADKAIKRSTELRNKGLFVEMLVMDPAKTKDDYAAYAVKRHINKVEFIEGVE